MNAVTPHTDELVRVAIDRGVATVTLDSPGNRNALSRRLMEELLAGLDTAERDPAVRAVMLIAAGRVFCSGADLNEARDGAAASGRTLAPALLTRLMTMTKPVVAAVDGAVRGGGMGVVAACDIALASNRATFAYSEARLGLVPAIASVPLIGRANQRLISRYALTGEVFGAAAALLAGIVSEVVPDGELDDACEAVLAGLCRAPASALAWGKRLPADLSSRGASDRLAALQWATELSGELFASPEAQEGMAAFVERRSPAWVIERS